MHVSILVIKHNIAKQISIDIQRICSPDKCPDDVFKYLDYMTTQRVPEIIVQCKSGNSY